VALIDDLREECDDLYAFVLHIPEEEWREPTAFWRWTTFDQIFHLLQVDRFALASVTDPVEFANMRTASREAAAAGDFRALLAVPVETPRDDAGGLVVVFLEVTSKHEFFDLVTMGLQDTVECTV